MENSFICEKTQKLLRMTYNRLGQTLLIFY